MVVCWCGYLSGTRCLYMAQLMPLPLTVSCFSKIQIGFTFLVPAHQSSPGKRAVKRVCVCLMLNPTFQTLGYIFPKFHKNLVMIFCIILLTARKNATTTGRDKHTNNHRIFAIISISAFISDVTPKQYNFSERCTRCFT